MVWFWIISAFIPETCCSVLERSGPCLVKLWVKTCKADMKGPGCFGILCGKKHRGSSVPRVTGKEGMITSAADLRGGHWLQRLKQFTKYFYGHHELGILNKVSDDIIFPQNLCQCRSGNICCSSQEPWWCDVSCRWACGHFWPFNTWSEDPGQLLVLDTQIQLPSGCESMLWPFKISLQAYLGPALGVPASKQLMKRTMTAQ